MAADPGGNPAVPPTRSWLDRALQVVAPVRPGEAVSALLLTLNVFILLTCYYVLKVLREPLILLGGGAELKAYASACQTLLLLAVVPLFGVLASRVNRIRLLTTMQVIFMLCLLAFYVLAQAEAPIGLAFYLWLGIFSALVVSNFWSFANDLYTPDQGKRLFPVVGLGGSVGAILGALVPQYLHRLIGGYELLLVAAGGLLISIVIYRLIDRRERIERDDRGIVELTKPEATHPVERDGGFTLVIKDRYLRLVAILVLVSTIVNTTGEYVVSKMAEDGSKTFAAAQLAKGGIGVQRDTPAPAPTATPATPAAGAQETFDPAKAKQSVEAAAKKSLRGGYLSDFYSAFYGVVNLLSALLQGLLVSRLLGKIGVRGALFVLPAIVMFGWIGFLMYATVATIKVTKTMENGFDYSLQNTVKQALYLPTSRASKYKAKAAVDTFFFRMGDVVAGLGVVFLLVSVLDLGVRAFAAVNLALGLLWMLIAFRTGRLHDQRAAERAERAKLGLRETAL